MNRFLPTTTRWMLGIYACCSLFFLTVNEAPAQLIAQRITNPTNPETRKETRQRVLLRSLLDDLSKKHQVLFSHNTDVVRDVYVEPKTLEIPKNEIERQLNDLLEGSDLHCKKIDNETFVIRSTNEQRLESSKSEKKFDGAGESLLSPVPAGSVVAPMADVLVKGKVKAALEGTPLGGATIRIKNKAQGTIADVRGGFAISVAETDTLLISYLGFEPQSVPVQGRTDILVSLELSLNNFLDQVVVVGYGTQKKSDITGSVANVKGEELSKQPVLTVTQALQGKVSGVQVIASGTPGSAPVVRIRGTGTILGGADPLYVVDGVLTNDIRNINTSDIASVDILKDASATAIYGVRAANGVIVITTKRGKGEKMTVTYDGFVGFRTPTSKVQMADSKLYVDYSNEALAYDNQKPAFSMDTIRNSTNWFDEITRSALIHNHAVSLSGSSEQVSYFVSAGYLNENGMLKGTNYERITLRANNEYRVASFLKIGNNLSLATDQTENKPGNAFTSSYRQAPIVPVRYADGSYGSVSQNNTANPVAELDFTNDRSTGLRLQGNMFAELNVLNHITARTSFSIENSNNAGRVYNPVYTVNANQRNLVSSLNISKGNGYRWIWDNTVSYANLFDGVHSVNVLAGTTSERGHSETVTGTRQNVPQQEQYWYLNAGTLSSAGNSGTGTEDTRNSYIGRLNYGYNGKYLVTATARYDGSSKFPTQNRWGFFPSVGLGWVLSEESFLKDGAFSLLKLRASWGRSGNDRIDPAAFLYTIASGLDYPLGNQKDLVQGNTITDVKDPNLRWEITQGINIGMEFALLGNKLYGEVEYYNKLTTDALINKPIDAVFGTTQYLTNAASIRNSGVEISLNWRDQISNDVRYSVGVNLTANSNSIAEVNGGLPITEGGIGNGQVTTRTEVGQPIGSFWLYETNGVFQSAADIKAVPHLGNAKPGDLRYKDNNGDGVIDDKDKIYAGSYQPSFYAGFNGSLIVGSLDFSFDCYTNVGNKVYNGKKAVRFGNENIEASRASRWTPTNPSNTEPRASNDVPVSSTYFLESGSFFRVNNITLGFTLPQEVVQMFGAQRFRVYIAAQNPIIIKSFSGYSPELPGGTLNSGIELGSYPVPSTYMFGINLGF